MNVCRPGRSPLRTPLTRLDSAVPQDLPRKPFKICTSIARPDLRIPKDLPRRILSRNSFVFRTYLYPLLGAENKRLITPVESARTENAPTTPLESALTKKGGGVHPPMNTRLTTLSNPAYPWLFARHSHPAPLRPCSPVQSDRLGEYRPLRDSKPPAQNGLLGPAARSQPSREQS